MQTESLQVPALLSNLVSPMKYVILASVKPSLCYKLSCFLQTEEMHNY